MSLMEKLHKLIENRSVMEYFQQLWRIADELALINALIIEDNLVVYALNSIGSDSKNLPWAYEPEKLAYSLKSSLKRW